jgi:hypothetical protein
MAAESYAALGHPLDTLFRGGLSQMDLYNTVSAFLSLHVIGILRDAQDTCPSMSLDVQGWIASHWQILCCVVRIKDRTGGERL